MICFAAATEAGFTRGIPGSNETYFNHACMIYGKQGKLHRTYIHYLCSSTPFKIKSSGAMPIMIWLTAGVSRWWGTTMPFLVKSWLVPSQDNGIETCYVRWKIIVCHGVGWGEHGPRGKCGGSVGGPGSHAGIVPASLSDGIGSSCNAWSSGKRCSRNCCNSRRQWRRAQAMSLVK